MLTQPYSLQVTLEGWRLSHPIRSDPRVMSNQAPLHAYIALKDGTIQGSPAIPKNE